MTLRQTDRSDVSFAVLLGLLLAIFAGVPGLNRAEEQLVALPASSARDELPIAGVFVPGGDRGGPLVRWALWRDGAIVWGTEDGQSYLSGRLDQTIVAELLLPFEGETFAQLPTYMPRNEFDFGEALPSVHFVRTSGRIITMMLPDRTVTGEVDFDSASKESMLRQLDFAAVSGARALLDTGIPVSESDEVFDSVRVSAVSQFRSRIPVPPLKPPDTMANPFQMPERSVVPLQGGIEPVLYSSYLGNGERVLRWAVWEDGTIAWNEWGIAPNANANRIGKISSEEVRTWAAALAADGTMTALGGSHCPIVLDGLLGHCRIVLRTTSGTVTLESSHPLVESEHDDPDFRPAFGGFAYRRGRTVEEMLRFEPECYRNMREAWYFLSEEFNRLRIEHAGEGTALEEQPWRWFDDPDSSPPPA